MAFKSKEKQTNCTYNPALDKYQDMDVFPEKIKEAREHLKDRNIRKEIEDELKKETILKP